jgi:hypothetical protein
VRALAEWGAITTRYQAEELLDLMLCPHFDQADWQARPLSRLAVSPTPTYTASNPVELMTAALPSRPNLEPSHNLPPQLTSFIGRHKEVAALKALLAHSQVRLVTLVGVGGCGKTRLSLQVAAELAAGFQDGVWFVELAPLSDPALIAQTIARTLGLPEEAGSSFMATLGAFLRARRLLLVLDN